MKMCRRLVVVGPKFSDHGISATSSDSSQTDLAYFYARDQGASCSRSSQVCFCVRRGPRWLKKFENLFLIICAMKSVSWDHFFFNNFDFL